MTQRNTTTAPTSTPTATLAPVQTPEQVLPTAEQPQAPALTRGEVLAQREHDANTTQLLPSLHADLGQAREALAAMEARLEALEGEFQEAGAAAAVCRKAGDEAGAAAYDATAAEASRLWHMLADTFQAQEEALAAREQDGPVEDQAQDTPEDAGQALAAAVAQAQTPEQVAAAAAAAEEAEQARLEDLAERAEKALVACRKAYSRGDKAHRQGLLESGRLASEFVALRLAAGATRDVAVQCVEGELAKVAWDKVDGNRLIRVYHVYRLLADGYRAVTEATSDPDVPYSHLRDVWTHLVQRVEEDPKQERWQLLPGQEQAAVATFVHCVKEHLDVAAVTDKVKAVQSLYAKAEQTRKAQAAAALEEQTKAQREEADRARQRSLEESKALAEQKRAVEEARAAAKAKADEETAAALAEQEAKLREQQRATILAQEAAAEEQRKARQRERALEEERKRLAREADKAQREAEKQAKAEQARLKAEQDKAAGKGQGKGQDKDPNAADHPGVASVREQQSRGRSGAAQGKGHKDDPLAALTVATAKEAAEQLVAIVDTHEAPDDLVEELLKGLVSSKELSNSTKRALQAALSVLRNPTPAASPSPVALAAHLAPATNGTAVAAH